MEAGMKWWVTALALACMATAMPSAVSAADPGMDSIVRGGRLYDNWYRELRVTPPRGTHPLFGGAVGLVSDAAATWRCTTCHGWDYGGSGGMPGITGYRGADPAAIVAILEQPPHGYGAVMRPGDLLDLAQFVSRGQLPMADLVDAKTRRSRVLAAGYEDRYSTICAGCHGADGKKVRDTPPLGEVARERPHEALHMILNGHPSGQMPALRVLGAEAAAGMLAFLQTLPAQNLAGSVVRGGRLYDNWQAELRTLPPSVPHPAYPRSAVYAEDAPRTWRCKECHGWDYLGRDGGYASGPHATGIKGIRDLSGAPPEQVIAVLRDETHRYGAVLKQRDLLDLAHFVSLGQIDMDRAIDRPTRKAKGVAARAVDYYGTICASCHGRDGAAIITTVPLGRLANDSPWEALHKILNGHPDEPMPALRVLGNDLLVDILAYLQTLPQDR
jgi:mono/diheme cytochrome c family protein